MASDSTAAGRLASAPVPRIAYQPGATQPSRGLPPPPPSIYRSNDTAPASNRPPLPSQTKSNRPKHYIDIRSLPETHPKELYAPKAGYAQPIA
jgi:hypothetical protein